MTALTKPIPTLAGCLALWLAGPAMADDAAVTVSPESQRRYGVDTAALQKADFQPSLAAWGEVLDPQPMLQQWSALAMAGIEAKAARMESTRSETLNREGRLASDRAVEEANRKLELADEQALLTRQALVANWGGQGLAALENDGLAPQLRRGTRALVRLSLPAGTVLPDSIDGAIVSPLAGVPRLTPVAIWPDPRVNATRQPGYLLVIEIKNGAWPVDAPVKGELQLPEKPLHGYNVPAKAVVFENGDAWVFQQQGDVRFVRHRIDIEHANPDGWFVDSDSLTPELPLVVSGAQGILGQKLLSAEGMAETD